MSDFLDGLYTGAWLHEVMEDSNPMPYLGPVARFEFGPIRESWGEWRYREWLHRLGLDDAGATARRVVALGPPPGVTWRHPGEMEDASRSFWFSTKREDQPVLHLSPKAYEAWVSGLCEQIQATQTPERIAAENLQCRMATLHPTWSACTALFFAH